MSDKYFYNYKNEFNFIINHYKTYGVVPDKLTFLAKFPDFSYVDVSEPNNYLLEQLYNDYNRSYLADKFNKIKPMLETDDDSSKAVDFFMKAIEDLHTGSVMTCTNLFKDTSRFDRYVERTVDQTKYYLTTGFAELDALIGGIDRENENMVISARPGQGKTQLLVKLATVASTHGLTVGIYEGEMTPDKIGYRVDTFLGHIGNKELNRGAIYVQREYEDYINRLHENAANWGDIKILTQNDVPGHTVNVNTLRTFIEQEHLDILFVDQYSLLSDTSTNSKLSEHEHIGHIAQEIKQLQVEKHIPIISVSQMNRTKQEDGKTSPDTTQIALSDKIPQYATVVIMLEQQENKDSQSMPVKLIFHITKSRDGGDNKKLTYAVNLNTGYWQFINEDQDMSEAEADAIADSYNPYTATGEDTPF